MKIIVDNKIPYITNIVRQIADDVVFASGKDFTPALIRNADALIIRTRTQCNKQLLEGSRVQLIVTATIGYDHIDTAYCRQAGITWSNAPGCNAASVAQYVQSALILLQRHRVQASPPPTIGIIGVGNVGNKVAQMAEQAGMRVLLNDPPRQDAEGSKHYTSLKEIAARCDIITFHTPLLLEGKYKTLHLANQAFFQSLQRRPVIINTSRGEVIETGALLNALNSGLISNAIIDVWENEPHINRELLDKAFIATPHIAGYSADGKANATRMSLETVCRHFNIPASFEVAPPPPPNAIIRAGSREEALLQIYNPETDSKALKTHPDQFEMLREEYPLRREENVYKIVIE